MKDLFLCHTGADKDWVRMLGTRLEAERINGRPIEVFFDEWDIDYGESIISKIDEGLKRSRYAGLVLSPRMVKAAWPTAEWQSQVMDDPTGKRRKVLPILRHKGGRAALRDQDWSVGTQAAYSGDVRLFRGA